MKKALDITIGQTTAKYMRLMREELGHSNQELVEQAISGLYHRTLVCLDEHALVRPLRAPKAPEYTWQVDVFDKDRNWHTGMPCKTEEEAREKARSWDEQQRIEGGLQVAYARPADDHTGAWVVDVYTSGGAFLASCLGPTGKLSHLNAVWLATQLEGQEPPACPECEASGVQ